MNIQLEIGELILEGFEYHDHRRIVSAMERELTRLVKENGLPRLFTEGHNRAIYSIAAPQFNVRQDRNPRQIGVEVARSVYRSLKR